MLLPCFNVIIIILALIGVKSGLGFIIKATVAPTIFGQNKNPDAYLAQVWPE